ncbi:MAG: 4a-hydroxytetrahydrobiopterin dehydratase [Myxococcaceae bacterium]
MSARARLDDAEVAGFLQANHGWRSEQGELRRTYEFNTFKESVRFVNEIALIAERENHHPDMDLHYRHVTIALITYDLDGVTSRDTEMAVKIDALRAGFGKGSP